MQFREGSEDDPGDRNTGRPAARRRPGTHDRGDGPDDIERLLAQKEQRECDSRLFDALSAEDFNGPVWAQLTSELAGYGYAIVSAWLHTGAIFAECRRRRRPVEEPPQTWTDDDRHDLAVDAVVKGIITFRAHGRAQKGWTPDGGASLKTYFIGTCILVFPAVYRPWRTRYDAGLRVRSAGSHHDLAAIGEPLTRQALGPEDIATQRTSIAEGLSSLPDDRVRMAVFASAMGFTNDEIADMLSINNQVSANTVKQILYRHRQRAQRGEPDE